MCTILLAWRCLDAPGFVLAANRDELVARPAAAPGRLSSAPPIFGGRDLLAAGTWLAVTPQGRVAAVTNRRGPDGDEVVRDPRRQSRGALPLRVLAAASPREALRGVHPAAHNPFNLLLVDADAALVGYGDGSATAPRIVDLAPGPHVLCVHDVDDASHAKERRLGGRLREAVSRHRAADPLAEAMVEILRDHSSGDRARDAACVHGEEYGTVSASLVIVDAAARPVYRHAPGRPCVTPFADVSLG